MPPIRLDIAFLGMTLGGVTFLVAGLATFLMVSQLQQRVIVARGPATQAGAIQYVQLPPQR